MHASGRLSALLPVIAVCGLFAAAAAGQQSITPPVAPNVRLEAEQQRREGSVFVADGNVEITYGEFRLRADHVRYDTESYQAEARGNVRLDVETQHLEAEAAELNVRTGAGRFDRVRGELRAQFQPNAEILVSPNPLVFEAEQVRRLDARTYEIDHVWLTVCEPDRPAWKFFASRATLHVERSVALVNANFRLFRIPLLYLPYASMPAGRTLRQSGFLLPEFSSTSVKGIVLGEGYYWAPKDWMDLSLGAAYMSRRGWQQNAEFRAKPWENVNFLATYFGVLDRGLALPSGARVNQGGQSIRIQLDARPRPGWHAAMDLNHLSSLTFRLAFSPTFGEAANSEVRSSGFVTNNFRGFSVNFAAEDYKNFASLQPETSVALGAAPEARFSSVDQAPWKRLPVYFGFEGYVGGAHRAEAGVGISQVDTAPAVLRGQIAPRVVLPLRWGPWAGVTASYAVRTAVYGSQILSGAAVNDVLRRTTGELTVDLRPPTLQRIWEGRGGKWKHTVEPGILYTYVRGVNQFDRFIRFDQDDTLTDTNEFAYSITQRLFHRGTDGQAQELASWRLAQKYYFDPTFNGALVPGTRNVFQALSSLTPFAFADTARRFSPIVSDLRITPGGAYDAQVQLNYDPVRNKLITAGTLLKLHPSSEFNFTVAHFSIDHSNLLQPLANQIRAQVGYGDLNRRGWNGTIGFSYDIRQETLQNQIVQASYNGSCCGLAFEYRRLALGPVRSENQFRVAFIIANFGTFGNLRRQERIF